MFFLTLLPTEAVRTIQDKSDYLGIDYSKIIPLLVEAIKDISSQLKMLQRQISSFPSNDENAATRSTKNTNKSSCYDKIDLLEARLEAILSEHSLLKELISKISEENRNLISQNQQINTKLSLLLS